ncbi:hypothetical protein Acr_00g0008310 [Actinidia rufa]|uniref:Retrotransposon gag domain-containing protein n=1 Tax=Actinidia rufa TaxID=165716 RepID=A0A7J0D8M6_9ERIC|nr:hypothetical protein Acr_00g0008310 [Actinidia rufa]
MHLLSRCLPRPNTSSHLDNNAHPMDNTSQAPNLEDLHREIHSMAEQMRVMNENNARLIQLLAMANPPPPAAPPIPDIERSHHSRRSGDHSQNHSTGREQKESDVARQALLLPDVKGAYLHQNLGVPVKVDTLVRQTEPPFTKRVLRARVSSRFKLPTQLGIYEGKTDPMDHLDSYKSLMLLQGYSDEVMCKTFSATLKGIKQKNASHLFTIHQKEMEHLKDYVKRFTQAILEVEDPSNKVVIMAMMEGLRPSSLFDSLSKNVPKTLFALQNKADKYIVAKELAEANHRRQGKDDSKRKEPDNRRSEYRDKVLMEIKHEEFVKWPRKIKTGPQKRNKNKYCESTETIAIIRRIAFN